MFIPRIRAATSKESPPASRRRRQLQCVIDLERLESRTPLSAGLVAVVSAQDHSALVLQPDSSSPSSTAGDSGPSVWLEKSGTARESPAVPAPAAPGVFAPSPIFGPPVISNSATGHDGEHDGLSDASGLPGSSVAPVGDGPGASDGLSTFPAETDGSAFGPVPWTLYAGRTNPSLEYPAIFNDGDSFYGIHSGDNSYGINSDQGFYGPNEGAPAGEYAGSVETLTVIFVFPLGPSATALAGPFHAPFSGPGENPFLRFDDLTPSFDTSPLGAGPAIDPLSADDGSALAMPMARDLVGRVETTYSSGDPGLASVASPSSTQQIAITSLQLAAVPNLAGHAATGSSIQANGTLALQVDHASEGVGGGWMSYVVGGDWSSGGKQVDSSPEDSVTPGLEGDEGAPAAIADGSAPFTALLAGAQMPTQTTSDDLEQVAELLPPSGSSLALVATLWTVPSGSSAREQADQSLDTDQVSPTDLRMTAPATGYVIGLDQGFEQIRRQIHDKHPQFDRSWTGSERDQTEIDRQLEWGRPVVPMAAAWAFDRTSAASGKSDAGFDDEAIEALAADRTEAPGSPESSVSISDQGTAAAATSEAASLVTASTLPLVAAVSASTALSGWLWRRRKHKVHDPSER